MNSYPAGESPRSAPNILIVDDDRTLLDLLNRVFRKLGFRVALADNGRKALELVQKAAPDVVLLDISMPGMDGIRVLKQIKAHDPDIEVVMVTGYASLDSAVEALKHGAFDYLQKPFEKLDRVVDAVRRAWETRKPCLERTSIRSSLERRVHELKVLHSINRVLSSCTDRCQMVEQLLESLGKLIDFDVAIVMLAAESGTGAMMLQVANPCTPNFVDQARFNLIDAYNAAAGSNMAYTAAFDRIMGEEKMKSTTTVASATTVDSASGICPGQPRIADKLNSFLNIPLISDGNMVGMVHVGSHRDEVFTPDVISLVYAVVSQLPSAIQRLEKVKSMERERTLKLAQIVSEGVILIDEDLRVITVNRAAQHALGISIEDLDLQMIKETFGVNLANLKKQSENESLDVVVKERSLDKERYEVKTSVIRREDGAFLGFAISMHKSPGTKNLQNHSEHNTDRKFKNKKPETD